MYMWIPTIQLKFDSLAKSLKIYYSQVLGYCTCKNFSHWCFFLAYLYVICPISRLTLSESSSRAFSLSSWWLFSSLAFKSLITFSYFSSQLHEISDDFPSVAPLLGVRTGASSSPLLASEASGLHWIGCAGSSLILVESGFGSWSVCILWLLVSWWNLE